METKPAAYKNILLALMMLLLWLPMIQNKLDFANVKPLEGDVQYPSEGVSNIENWFSGEYQQRQETYLNSAFGFRNLCIRINNQIAYSIFNKPNANKVIVGKDQYLFEEYYIDTYMGADFLGVDSIDRITRKLKFVSDTLKKLNKTLLVVFAAGKASFYPEFIPAEYKPVNDNTNYKQFTRSVQQAGLNVIDFNRWFMDHKNTSKYPLYPKYGIHWSKYGSVLAIDSIIKKIEQLRGIDMPNLYYDSVKIEQPHGIDYDIGGALNLLVKLKSFDMAYITPKFESDSGKMKPAILTIADSFYWEMYGFGLSAVFSTEHFWYYNKMVYPESFNGETLMDYLNFGNEIKNHDVIMIMATEANLKKIGWGFIENAYTYFTKPELPHSDAYYVRLRRLFNYIKTDAKWFEEVQKRAEADDTNINAQLVKEAKWVLQNEGVY